MEPLHVFRDRKDPFKVYKTEKAFRQRFRLSQELVGQLATEFGQSEWATNGTRHAKGLSHRERVGRKINLSFYRFIDEKSLLLSTRKLATCAGNTNAPPLVTVAKHRKTQRFSCFPPGSGWSGSGLLPGCDCAPTLGQANKYSVTPGTKKQ